MWPASPPPVTSGAVSCGSVSMTAAQATLFGSDPVLRVLRERYLLHLVVGVCFGQLAPLLFSVSSAWRAERASVRVAHALCAAALTCVLLAAATLVRGGDGPPQQPLRAGSSDGGDPAEPAAKHSRCVPPRLPSPRSRAACLVPIVRKRGKEKNLYLFR